jgi:hypothetical protein
MILFFFFVHLVAMPKVETTEKYERHCVFLASFLGLVGAF